MQFAYTAIRSDGRNQSDVVEAGSAAEAAAAIRSRGFVPISIAPAGEAPRRSAAPQPAQAGRATRRDLLLFTRQMKMLLEAGAPLVTALETVERQSTRAAFRDGLRDIRESVEQGGTLTAAIQAHPRMFTPVFATMIAAGESTATLPQVFSRLGELQQQQERTRKVLVGATVYPSVLCVLLTIVILVLLGFVIPRFKVLFASLRSPLPASTQILMTISEGMTAHWPWLVGGAAGFVVGVVLLLRTPALRTRLDEVLLRTPLIGGLVARLSLARVLRIWAATLNSHVPLLDAIRQSRDVVSAGAFRRLVDDVERSVSGGGRVGQALAAATFVEPVIVSAISIGEENGRLTEAIDFVSSWLDTDNADALRNVTRLAEPLLLGIMGIVVGIVASALFIPLFDMASAAG